MLVCEVLSRAKRVGGNYRDGIKDRRKTSRGESGNRRQKFDPEDYKTDYSEEEVTDMKDTLGD